MASEVSSLLKFLAHPRTGHIYQALHIFKYLETHMDNELAFVPMYLKTVPKCDPETLIREMKQVYVDVEEDPPSNAPPPRGKNVQINCFVDCNHGRDRVTRHSQTGTILFGNKEPLLWYSKHQNTV